MDCDRQLSAEVIRQREDEGEALVCDVCRIMHLSYIQDGEDLMDEASADTQLSPDAVSEGTTCKLQGCNQQAQVENRECREPCCGHPNLMFSTITPSPVLPMSPMTQMSLTSSTGGHMLTPPL